jgi:hypothetical protein
MWYQKYILKKQNKNLTVVDRKTAHNRTVYASPPYGGSGYEKPQTAHSALVRLFSATFGAGVIASQCPITRPKRHIQQTVMRNVP